MTDEILFQHGNTIVRRLRLAPGEAMPWHRDPFHRVAVVLPGRECVGGNPTFLGGSMDSASLLATLDTSDSTLVALNIPTFINCSHVTAAGLRSGLLIYAAGEGEPKVYEVVNVGKKLEVAALAPDAQPGSILSEIAVTAEKIKEPQRTPRVAPQSNGVLQL